MNPRDQRRDQDRESGYGSRDPYEDDPGGPGGSPDRPKPDDDLPRPPGSGENKEGDDSEGRAP